MGVITPLLFLFGSAILLYIAIKKFKTGKLVGKFTGPRGFPIVGNSFYFFKTEERLPNLIRLQRDFGNRVLLHNCFTQGVVLFHPDDVQKILTSKEINKSSLYDMMLTDWIGSSIFYAKDQDYFRLRKMLLPALDIKHVDNIEQNFNEHSRTLVKVLKINESNGMTPEIRFLFSLCTLDMVTQYLVGKGTNCLSSSNQDYVSAVHNQTKYVTDRGVSPWLWPSMFWRMSPTGRKENSSRKYLHSFVDKIVQDRRKEIRATKNYPSLQAVDNSKEVFPEKAKLRALDLLLREQELGQNGITDKYIRDEINFLKFAGHDTITTALTFAVFLLASNPEEQAKLHLELDEVLGPDRDRNVDASDLSQLKYLECCIKESLRLFPPAPSMLRQLDKDFELDKDTILPKGLHIMISPWVMHRVPEFFPEPNKFQPSRFQNEKGSIRHPYSYIPFSAGPRNCMGQKTAMVKAKTILAHIFRSFQIELVSPPEKMIPMGSIIIYPKGGLNIRLKSR